MLASISSKQGYSPPLAVTYQSTSLNSTVAAGATTQEAGTTINDTIRLQGETLQVTSYADSVRQKHGNNGGVKYGLLQSVVTKLLHQQGINSKIAVGDGEIDIATLTPEKAQELVSEDGAFTVENTAKRIFDFAVSVAGGDTNRIDAIKAGIEKGFAQATQAFGGTLPDICHDTYNAVMGKLDGWVSESKAVA